MPPWINNYIYNNLWGELLIHSQTSTVKPLKFVNVYVILSHILLGIWLLIHAEMPLRLLMPWHLIIRLSSHSNCIEDQEPRHEFYLYPVLKYSAVTQIRRSVTSWLMVPDFPMNCNSMTYNNLSSFSPGAERKRFGTGSGCRSREWPRSECLVRRDDHQPNMHVYLSRHDARKLSRHIRVNVKYIKKENESFCVGMYWKCHDLSHIILSN